MKFAMPLGQNRTELFWRVLSVGLFYKIMGIGVVVAAVFGGFTLLAVRTSTSRALTRIARQQVESVARHMVLELAEPMVAKDANRVEEILRQFKQTLPDVRYVVVRDGAGHLVSHTSNGEAIPRAPPAIKVAQFDHQKQVEFNHEKLVFEVAWPIVDHRERDVQIGALQLSIQDRTIRPQLAMVTWPVYWTLFLCAAIGFGLAFLLSFVITHPIRHLVEAANRIGSGAFETRAEVFSEDEIGRLAVAFNEMSAGLQNYRQEVQEKETARLALIKKIVHAQEKERKSISLELHDQLGQSLLALLLVVQSLSKEKRLSGDALQNLEVQILQVLEEVRRLAWGMRPSVLDDYGLDRALSRLVEEIEKHSDLTIDYQFSGPPNVGRLPPEIEVTLYRIAQEALANVVRHADAVHASVIVLWHRSEVTLLIEDHGCGFDSDSTAQDVDSLGLTGMQERAALLGGSCAVESAAGQGTTIRAKIPLNKA